MIVLNELIILCLTFFKIGLFTFGGGYAMLPLIQQEVLKNSWLNIEELINFIAVSESTPGPFAINMATYLGSNRLMEVTGGNVLLAVTGAVAATLGVVLPSFIIILIVAHFYEKFKTNKCVAGIMTGLKPAVIGLIGSAAVTMAKTVFFSKGITVKVLVQPQTYISLVLFCVMTFLVIKKKTHPIIIISLSAVVGIISGYLLKM